LASTARPLLSTLVLLAVLALLGATVLVGRTWRSAVRTWALPMLIGGIVIVGLSITVDPIAAAAVAALRSGLTAWGMATGLVGIVGSSATAMVDRSGWLLLEIGAPLVAIALLLFLGSLQPAGRRRVRS
jgi:hypothetical protein